MSNLLGQQIGRYQLLDVIGQGGMGIVYRAFDPAMNRSVAIKTLHRASAEDKNLVAMFRREARSTASLQHNNIVTVFSLEESDGLPYLVMDYLEGQSIAQMVSARQPIRLVEKIGLICQVCDGLQYAHQRPEPVIHRDIKPANILVLRDGTAKIIDFGIARVASCETMTQTGQVRGSLPYMSPEQLGGTPLDSRTDIYSAGVTLFEFLTGEHPFKCPEGDLQATIARILNDPIPPLSKYLSDYPPELDQIICKAMARSTEARYQNADDLGYELSRVQETLKLGMNTEFLARAKAAIESKDWETARQLLQEIQKSDRRNSEAADLLQVVRQEFQRQQRSVQIGQLRSQAQNALAEQKFEEALECVDQALRLDPDDAGLIELSRTVKDQIERERKLSEALRQGHAALFAGDLSEAENAVKRALQIDQKNTEARALESLIEKELSERQRRVQYQGLLEEARHEISSRNYLSALNHLQKAKEINPSDSHISELINWAAQGHQKERRRQEIEQWTNVIGNLLSESSYDRALEACEAALVKFPEDSSLLKLKQLAKHQQDLVAKRHLIDKAGVAAHGLVAAAKYDEALILLVDSLRSFPGDPNLETLLAITRAESERRLEEQRKEQDQITTSSEPNNVHTAALERQSILNDLKALKHGLARQLSIPELQVLAAPVEDAIRCGKPDVKELPEYSNALADFDLRLSKWKSDTSELERLAISVRELNSAAEIDSLVGQACSVAEQYPKDGEIRTKYGAIRHFANELTGRRETANRQISELLLAMQAEQDISSQLSLESKIREIAKPWLRDHAFQDLLSQATTHLNEARQRKEDILIEVDQLTNSIRAARSNSQVKLLFEQVRLLTAECFEPDVKAIVRELQCVVQEKLDRLERTVARLRQLATDANAARTLQEAENCVAAAEKLVSQDTYSEDANDLLRRIQHGVAERKKEYRRVGASLETLIDSSANAKELAELDLILARRRDLVKKYSDETYFRDLELKLEASVVDRKAQITELAALNDDVESVEADDISEAEEDSASVEAAHVGAISTIPAVLSKDGVSTSFPSRHLLVKTLIPILALAGTMVVVSHYRTANTIPAPTNLSKARTALPETKIGSVPEPAANTSKPPGTGSISVETGVSGVSVFLDGRLQGYTSHSGQFTVPAAEGARKLKIWKDGYKEVEQNIPVSPNANVIVPIAMEKASPSSASVLPVPPGAVAAESKTSTPPVTTTTVTPQPQSPVPAPAAWGSISAEFGKVAPGQPVNLTWKTGNANDVTIENLGPVGDHGSKVVNPDKSTTYRLTARGTAGVSQLAEVTIEVLSPVRTPSPVPVDLDIQGIKSALQKYKEAYQSESIDDMKKVWPKIPASQLKDLVKTFDQYNAIRLELNCQDPNISSGKAAADCRGTFTYTVKGRKIPGEPFKSHVGLYKEGEEWKVESVR